MTAEEAKRVVEIMMTADGGCSSCARDLLEEFSETFPEFRHVCGEAFKEMFDRFPDFYDPDQCRKWVPVPMGPPYQVPVPRCTLPYGHEGEHQSTERKP